MIDTTQRPAQTLNDQQCEEIAAHIYATVVVDSEEAAFQQDWALVRAGYERGLSAATPEAQGMTPPTPRAHFVDPNNMVHESKMPEPTYIYHPSDVYGEDDLFEFAKSGDVACPDCINLYTATQMREYAQEATRQAMQLAENACARIESSEWEQYKGRAVNQVAEKAANPYIAGKSDGASDCFDAIRAITHESEKRHG